MAERIVRQLVDDIDGSEIAEGGGERVDFSFRGIDYQIDLSEANIAELERILKPYIDAAAKVRSSSGRRTNGHGNGKASKEQLAAIRDWARKHGYEVSDRGRIKASVLRDFEAAH